MKIKIVAILVCVMLIWSTTTIALTSLNTNELQSNNQRFDTIPLPLPTPKGWMKTFGETGYDYGYSVQQTTDGGYIIAGETKSLDMHVQIWVIKTDGEGNIVWDKIFGGSNKDYYPYVIQTDDNGYIFTARTYSFGAGENDLWVVKLDENGAEQWNTTFGKQFFDYSSKIQQTIDGGYILIGSINLYEPVLWDVWLIKIDSNGKEQWNRTFGESQQEDFGESVLQTPDGGYIVVGSTMSYGHDKGYACWVIKTDEQGHEQWNRTYADMYSWGGARVVEFASDGGYVIFGNKGYYTSSQVDVRCIKINQYGDEQWNKTYGGIKDDQCLDASQTSDEGYIMIGLTNSSGAGGYDVWMSKIDAYGNEQWEKTYGGKNDDYGHSIDITTDGGYIITGSKGSNIKDDYSMKIWLIKTDSQGKSKTISSGNLWFEWLFQRFSNAFPLLRHFLQ